jgi:hypothetical protein
MRAMISLEAHLKYRASKGVCDESRIQLKGDSQDGDT